MTQTPRIKLLSVHTDTTHEGDLAKSNLVSLWIEQPANCSLQCPMCFASTMPCRHKKAPQPIPDHIYEAIIRDFAGMPGGIKKLAIPGAGEPFHEYNRELTWKMIRLTAELDMALTIFTTAHLMTEEDVENLRRYDHVLLLVKYNSRNRKIQEELVFQNPEKPTDPTYFDLREAVFAQLIKAGFNGRQSDENQEKYGNHTRLGIVTSIMEQNIDEIVPLLEMARDNNLVFDCDTILPRGRGERFSEEHKRFRSGQALDVAIRKKIEELQEIDKRKYHNEWQIGGTYVGATCTRFCNHLYIDFKGDVHPCIGATKVTLGNIVEYRQGDLSKYWDKPAMRVIRDRNYTGVCPTCLHFGVDCHSCLGRSTSKHDPDRTLCTENLEKHGVVHTWGCLNHLPIINVLIAQKSAQLRSILLADRSNAPTRTFQGADIDRPGKAIRSGQLEELWLPEPSTEGKNGEGIRYYKDHYLLRLQGAPWRWGIREWKDYSQLLPFIFLPVIARLFEKDLDPDGILLWCNLLLYDEIRKKYFYRIVMREEDNGAYGNILLSRWAEATPLLTEVGMERAAYSRKILDLSDILRDKDGRCFNYRIIVKGEYQDVSRFREAGSLDPEVFDLRPFYARSDVQEKIADILKFLQENTDADTLVEVVATKILTDLASSTTSNTELTRIRDFYGSLANFFLNEGAHEKVALAGIPDNLYESCKAYQEKNPKIQVNVRLVNYLLFLGAMHKELAGYEMRHSMLHGQAGADSSGIILATRCAKTGLRGGLSEQRLTDQCLATVDVALNTLLLPIISMYEKKFTVEKTAADTTRLVDLVLHHDMTTLYGDLTAHLASLVCDVTEKYLSDEEKHKKPTASFFGWIV